MKKALVTGAFGLTGSEMCKILLEKGWEVVGIDADIRSILFGKDASTVSVGQSLIDNYPNFTNYSIDIRHYEPLKMIFEEEGPFDFVVHAAAQPAHEWSTDNAREDFAINAVGTVNVLECYRHFSPEAPFIYVSSSKVSGDLVNNLPLEDFGTRYDLPKDHPYYEGVDEEYCRIDGSGRSLFGSSKACADIEAQEYARYFNLPIGIFRPVCISGSAHKGAELHGYLAYLVKCVAEGRKYYVNGYEGKQVRDNIHAHDLAMAFYHFYKSPKSGAVYNIGAGRLSNNSILEALNQAGEILNSTPNYEITNKTRKFDHKWCIYSAEKFRKDYPDWEITYNNDKLMEEICSQYLLINK